MNGAGHPSNVGCPIWVPSGPDVLVLVGRVGYHKPRVPHPRDVLVFVARVGNLEPKPALFIGNPVDWGPAFALRNLHIELSTRVTSIRTKRAPAIPHLIALGKPAEHRAERAGH
jgi:hypothetical protein